MRLLYTGRRSAVASTLMSLRPAVALPKAGTPHGSLFGPAISAPQDGFWSLLAVSPPRSPPTAALDATAPMPPEFSLDVDMVDAAACSSVLPSLPSVAAATALLVTGSRQRHDEREVPVLESVCPTWAYDLGDQTALVVFDHDQSGTMTLQSTPRRIYNRDPVTAKAIAADGVSWKPMLDAATGTSGHVFQLTRMGAAVCRIEAISRIGGDDGADDDAPPVLGRVAVVQASYAPLAMAAGIADRSSLLVYDDPHAHLQTLRELRTNLGADPELGYAPVSECCVTGHLDRLVLLRANHASRADHERAQRAWSATRAFLRSMSALTADCVDWYADAEIRRAGAHELRGAARAWRRAVA